LSAVGIVIETIRNVTQFLPSNSLGQESSILSITTITMKLSNLIAIIALALPFASSATTSPNPIEGPLSNVVSIVNDYYSLDKIFFNDEEGAAIFVDFEVIKDDIVELNVMRDSKLMMQDIVTDLPADAIYEINLDVFRKGAYTIEIVTKDQIKIQKVVFVE